MKRITTFITNYVTLIAALLLPIVMFVPMILERSATASNQEQLLLDVLRVNVGLTVVRTAVLVLIVLNLLLTYIMLHQWFGRRRAELATLMASCIPLLLLAQYSIIHLTMVLTPILIAFVAFDRAGRSDKAAGWYTLAGIMTTTAWIQEPVGVTLLLLMSTLLLIAVKPKYIKHIARQSSLVPIILIVAVAGLAAASVKFNFGFQDYLVDQLTPVVHLMIMPKLLLDGPSSYRYGLPGVSIIPLAVMLLAGFGALQLVVTRRRPRNAYILALPVLLLVTALAFTGITSLLLIAVALICIAAWAASGVNYLYASWKQLFPHNTLANRTAVVFLSLMIASLMLYSYWYVAKGWYGSPQSKIDITKTWDGSL